MSDEKRSDRTMERDVTGGDGKTRHMLPMVCVCTFDGDELLAAAEASYERAKARLSQGSSEVIPLEASDRTMVDDLIWSLTLDHNASVTHIWGDQWFAVEVQVHNGPLLFVECDRPTDGLVAIWEWLEQKKAAAS